MEYLVKVVKINEEPSDEGGGKIRRWSHQSIVRADDYKDAKRVADALEFDTGSECRRCVICVRIFVWGKSVLVPVDSITDQLIQNLAIAQEAARSSRGLKPRPSFVAPPKTNNGSSPSCVMDNIEDELHRLARSVDEVDKSMDF